MGFAGTWFTTFGEMRLEQRGSRVAGAYRYGAAECELSGSVRGSTLEFTYAEPTERGTGRFKLVRSGKFEGTYRSRGQRVERRWEGHRGWDGLWESSPGSRGFACDIAFSTTARASCIGAANCITSPSPRCSSSQATGSPGV